MADVLSQNEVDALLATVGGADAGAALENTRYKYYDFARPERDNLDPIGRAENYLKSLESAITSVIASKCSSSIKTHFEGISSKSWSDFAARLGNPTCIATSEAVHSGGSIAIEITNAILFPMLTSLLGAQAGMEGEIPLRAMTRIEQRLITGIIKEMLERFSEQLPEKNEELKFLQLDTAPTSRPLAEPNSALLIAEFDISIEGRSGALRIAIPKSALERMFALPQELEAHITPAELKREAMLKQNTARAVAQVRVKISAELQAGNMSLRQLASLSVGSAVYSGTKPGAVKLTVSGKDLLDAELLEAENTPFARVAAARSVFNAEKKGEE